MAPINVVGPEAFDATPPDLLDVGRVAELLRGGAWVIDLRNRNAFAGAFLQGAVNAELRNDLANYLGWFVPFGEPLVLVGDDEKVVAEAQRMLSRIGYDRLQGRATLTSDDLAGHEMVRSIRVGRFTDLDEVDPATRHVLDVRDGWEFTSGHHADALHIPFYELSDRLAEVPSDKPVWLYCATGARATIAASFLVRSGRDVVLIDDFCLPGDVPGRTSAASSA
jgi:rhodanese-related sulfurtransferase